MKILKVLKSTFIIITISVFVISCEDFIDLQPRDRISSDDYWKTAQDLENYVLQFYPEFPGHSGAGIVKEDLNSDNVIRSTPEAFINGERSTRTGNWRSEWKNVRDVNIFFDNYQKCEENFNAYKHFLGEAQFFRAWFYFGLLKTYGDIPWYSKSLLPDDEEELMKPRAPRTQIVDSILVDLDNAILNLDPKKKLGNLRINKEAALALKSRVALYEGTWQKYHANTPFGTSGVNPNKYFQACIVASQELINGDYEVGIYETGNPERDYYELFGLDNMSGVNEIILYRTYNASDGFGNNVQHFTTNNTDELGVTWDLVSSYLNKNGKPYNYLSTASTKKGNDFLLAIAEDCDPRLKATIWIPGDLRADRFNSYFDKPWIDKSPLCPTGFQIKKTSNPYSPVAGGVWAEQSNTGYIIFRFGEVLLNYAEAKFELDGTVAYDALNLLRKRAGMPDFEINSQTNDPNYFDYGYSIPDGLYEIRRERRVELALEGKRQEDLMRWAAHNLFKDKRPLGYPFNPNEFPSYNPPLDENGLIDYMKNSLPNGYQFRENRDYLTSIPQDELTLNPNLIQNPGW